MQSAGFVQEILSYKKREEMPTQRKSEMRADKCSIEAEKTMSG